MGWLYFVGYVFFGVLSARAFYSAGFKSDYEDSLRHNRQEEYARLRMSEEKMLESARSHGFFCSIAAIFWPFAWPAFFILSWISRPTAIERQLAFDKDVDAEMEKLRKMFAAVDIPPVSEEMLCKMAEENVRNER